MPVAIGWDSIQYKTCAASTMSHSLFYPAPPPDYLLSSASSLVAAVATACSAVSAAVLVFQMCMAPCAFRRPFLNGHKVYSAARTPVLDTRWRRGRGLGHKAKS